MALSFPLNALDIKHSLYFYYSRQLSYIYLCIYSDFALGSEHLQKVDSLHAACIDTHGAPPVPAPVPTCVRFSQLASTVNHVS